MSVYMHSLQSMVVAPKKRVWSTVKGPPHKGLRRKELKRWPAVESWLRRLATVNSLRKRSMQLSRFRSLFP